MTRVSWYYPDKSCLSQIATNPPPCSFSERADSYNGLVSSIACLIGPLGWSAWWKPWAGVLDHTFLTMGALASVSQHYAASVPGPPRLQWVLLDLGVLRRWRIGSWNGLAWRRSVVPLQPQKNRHQQRSSRQSSRDASQTLGINEVALHGSVVEMIALVQKQKIGSFGGLSWKTKYLRSTPWSRGSWGDTLGLWSHGFSLIKAVEKIIKEGKALGLVCVWCLFMVKNFFLPCFELVIVFLGWIQPITFWTHPCSLFSNSGRGMGVLLQW